jgi:hypothetical protein
MRRDNMTFSNIKFLCFVLAIAFVGGAGVVDEVKWRLAKRKMDGFVREKERKC